MFGYGSSCNEKKVAHNNGVFVGCGYLMYFIIKYDIRLFQKWCVTPQQRFVLERPIVLIYYVYVVYLCVYIVLRIIVIEL